LTTSQSSALPQEGGLDWISLAAKALKGDASELERGRTLRLEADRNSSMSERLARVHVLCKQMSAIKGTAKAR
jgi:hypothetical protein